MESLSSTICRACRHRLLKTASTPRPFSTTSARSYIPPESPAYIDVPQPLQQVQHMRPRAKGILPLPRELFPRNRPDKPNQKYLDNVTRDPKPENTVPEDELSESGRYKRRMAELRKTHLRSGLKELYARKTDSDNAVASRSAAKNVERARLITQQEREDERLTNVSIPSSMRPQSVHTLSPEQELEIYHKRRAAHEAQLAAKHDDRLDKLHTLYMHARSFITTKEQLATAIDNVFVSNRSIFDERGIPESVTAMIRQGQVDGGSSNRGGTLTASAARSVTDQERMQRIAEKLSGGKM